VQGKNLIFRKFLNIKLRANLLKNKLDVDQDIAENAMDEFFDSHLRPLRSKNARTIFQMFVNARNVKFLTTLDLQTKLDGLGILLSKKEINGWLRSLYDAGLIGKEEDRGKPTTLAYENKYTFDMWMLTTKGKEIAEGIEEFLKGKTEPITFLSERNIEEIAVEAENIKQQILSKIDELYIQLACLRNLWIADDSLTMNDLMKSMTPQATIFERAFLSFLRQGLLAEVETSKTKDLFSRLLHFIGISQKRETIYHLTEKGRHLTEKLWPKT
jgi:hypothetical protein